MTDLEKHIKEEGGIMSGDLAQYIITQYNVAAATARKRIERLQSPIHKLRGLFSDNQSFIYHASNFCSQIYFDRLEDAFRTSAKRCYSLIVAINYFHGIIKKSDLPNYSISPISKIKGHIQFDTLIQELINAKVILDYDDEHYCLNSFIAKQNVPNHRYYKAQEFVTDLIKEQFLEWSRNIGLHSFASGRFNSTVGGFQFAFTAPSYIRGLVQYKDGKPQPGFVVADVLLGNSITEEEIYFFINKIDSILNQSHSSTHPSPSSARLFPIFICENLDTVSLKILKSAGVLVATIRELFGKNSETLLKELINTITNASAILKNNPEQYIKMMEGLRKLVDGKTNNLRGDLFELAVGYYYGCKCKWLEIGTEITTIDGKKRDIDVLAKYDNEIRIVECKGYKNPIDHEYVDKYLGEKIPNIKTWLDTVHPNKKYIFEIWSTGGYSDKAIELLETAKNNTKKYAVDYLDKEQILKRASELSSPKFKDILKDYYLQDMF